MAASIESISNFILKPSPLPNGAVTPLTAFDRAAGDFHCPVLLAFRSTMPSNSVLTDSLSRVLAPYPHLAGVRLVETQVNVPMDEKELVQNPGPTATPLSSLYPPLRHGCTEILFQVQLNRYACGGMVVGFTYPHTVADALSTCRFLTRWAEAARGAPAPYVDRNSLFVPRNPSTCKYGPREQHPPVDNLTVQFPAEFISELKRRVPYRCTTFECLLAHVWKKIAVARGHGHGHGERTRIRVAVNGRGRMRPVVPIDHFGDLPTSRVGEVVGNDIGSNVRTIRKAVKQLSDDYFRSFIDFGEILEEELMVSAEDQWGNLLHPDLEVDSWLGFPVDDIDFGSGGPKAILSPGIPVEGIVTFVDSLADGEKGGVNVYITLRRDHVHKFNTICFSLD